MVKHYPYKNLKREIDLRSEAQKYKREATQAVADFSRSKKEFYKNKARVKFLEAANFLRGSLRALFYHKSALNQAIGNMIGCYNSALEYASGNDNKLVRQEKNYANLFLKELKIRKELEEMASKKTPLSGMNHLGENGLGALKRIKSEYSKMLSEINAGEYIPEKYISKEKENLQKKISSISKTLEENQLEEKNLIHQEQSFRNPFGLEYKLASAVISVSVLVASIFFLSMSLTGNVVGEISIDSSRIIGVILFICGLVFSFVYLKGRK